MRALADLGLMKMT